MELRSVSLLGLSSTSCGQRCLQKLTLEKMPVSLFLTLISVIIFPSSWSEGQREATYTGTSYTEGGVKSMFILCFPPFGPVEMRCKSWRCYCQVLPSFPTAFSFLLPFCWRWQKQRGVCPSRGHRYLALSQRTSPESSFQEPSLALQSIRHQLPSSCSADSAWSPQCQGELCVSYWNPPSVISVGDEDAALKTEKAINYHNLLRWF